MKPRITFRKGYWRVSPFPVVLRRSTGDNWSLLKLYNLAHVWACKANNKLRERNALSNQVAPGSCQQQGKSKQFRDRSIYGHGYLQSPEK